MELKYNLDSNGKISEIGYVSNYSTTITTEPFGLNTAFDYRFDFENKTWIYDPIMIVTQSISKLQCVAYLLEIGRYAELMAIIDADTTGVSQILFDAAAVLDRDSNMVNQIAAALGFSSEDTDDFFVEASKILV